MQEMFLVYIFVTEGRSGWKRYVFQRCGRDKRFESGAKSP